MLIHVVKLVADVVYCKQFFIVTESDRTDYNLFIVLNARTAYFSTSIDVCDIVLKIHSVVYSAVSGTDVLVGRRTILKTCRHAKVHKILPMHCARTQPSAPDYHRKLGLATASKERHCFADHCTHGLAACILKTKRYQCVTAANSGGR